MPSAPPSRSPSRRVESTAARHPGVSAETPRNRLSGDTARTPYQQTRSSRPGRLRVSPVDLPRQISPAPTGSAARPPSTYSSTHRVAQTRRRPSVSPAATQTPNAAAPMPTPPTGYRPPAGLFSKPAPPVGPTASTGPLTAATQNVPTLAGAPGKPTRA